MGSTAMRSSTLAAILMCAALAACESGPFKRSESLPQQQTMQQQQLPPIKVEEATPRYKAELHTDLAAGYFERGQYDVALEELGEGLKADPTYPKLYSVYGLVYTELGDEPKAELNFRKGLELAPADSEVRHNWGWYLCTHGKPRESIPEFEVAIRNPLYKSTDIALTNAGRCSADYGDTQRADDYFKRALSINPANTTAAYSLALLSYREARLAEARTLIRRVMQQTQQPQPEALFLGMCIEHKLGDRGSEASYASQLRNRFPESAEAKAISPTACP